MRVLTVNSGSSSLKVDLVDGGEVVASYQALPTIAPRVDAVGHRIVHGGPHLVEPVVIDAAVEQQLRDLVDLAPLHQVKSLEGLDAARKLLPDVPHVACFDTAFHASMPPAAFTYALPQQWRERWVVRRFGFHGLSHAWAARRAAELVPEGRRVVTCQLGSGASLAAVLDGHSVDTTMGFTPVDGLVMATRSGSVDPGLISWLEEYAGLSSLEIAHSLTYESGLLGLAGTADMRELLNRRDEQARLALEVYLHRLAGSLAAMTVGLGGLDVVVFTGGVGEHAPAIRSRTAALVAHLGMRIDEQRNLNAEPDTEISARGAAVRTLVIAAHENLVIAAGVEGALAGRLAHDGD